MAGCFAGFVGVTCPANASQLPQPISAPVVRFPIASTGEHSGARPLFYAQSWLHVRSGGQTTCGITTDQFLWCWGDDEQGQMGIGQHGSTASTSEPFQVDPPSTWTRIAVGGEHTCGIRTDGSLWCWGYNHFGQLGIGTKTLHDVPQRVGDDSDWTSVAAGSDHTCATKDDGTLWCWGRNDHGQLGLGSTRDSDVPAQVGSNGWAKEAAGGDHTCAIQADGSLWCWGDDAKGDLGIGSTKEQNSPVQVGDGSWSVISAGMTHTCAIGAGASLGRLSCWGDDGAGQWTTPHPVGNAGTWISVSAGDHDTCGTRQGDTSWCWGSNRHGQLGQGDVLRRRDPTAITFRTGWETAVEGGSTSCAIRVDTTLWCWGYNSFGQVGDHAREDRFLPTDVNYDTRWLDVSDSGGSQTCAISDMIHFVGWLYCWGVNDQGQLGDGTTVDETLPEHIGRAIWSQVSAGEAFTCGVQKVGSLWCWGANEHGQLGDGTTKPSTVPVRIGAATNWVEVSSGQDHACAVRSDGSLWCWGDNADGELGDGGTTGATTPHQVRPPLHGWAFVSAGLSHTCAIQKDKSLWCWGDNADGEIGDRSRTQRDTPVAVAGGGDWSSIDVGGDVSCGLQPAGQSAGTLFCWGLDDHGQAGLGGGRDVLAPTAVGGSDWLQVSVGLDHSCGGRTEDGDSLWCWGVAKDGDLGDGQLSGEEDRPARMHYQLGDPWVAGFTYDDRTCGLKQFTECFGDDSVGQLGDGSPTPYRVMPTTIFVIPG